MAGYSRTQAAERAGVGLDEVDRMIELGLIVPDATDGLTGADVRRIGLLANLISSGIPDAALAERMRDGDMSLEFMDSPALEIFSALSSVTFGDLSRRTGIPVELLLVIREAIGSSIAQAGDRVRDIELAMVPSIEAQRDVGFPDEVIERLLRTLGEGLRRYVQAEAAAFEGHVIRPVAHLPGHEISAAAARATERLGSRADAATLAILHAQQAHAWTANILEGFERSLARAGVYSRAQRPPAMCFLDITGYTRLTAERGDRAAADLADQLGRLVGRISMEHGGRTVKWLGDGVMFWFREPGGAALASLEMASGVRGAGLPPAHVGIHAGPVLAQDGDYYGQTVNIASRIADYARPGEVLVSQAVVDAAGDRPLSFTEIGPVELKGMSAPITLYAAGHAPSPAA